MRTLVAAVLAIVAPSIAVACPPDPAPTLALFASTTGTTLHLTFTNVSDQPIELPVRVRAGELQYDWLTVEVFDTQADDRLLLRTLTFVEDRTKAVMQTVRIAPGGSHAESIDLARWIAKPLSPGRYDLGIRWQGAPAWADSMMDTLYAQTSIEIGATPPLQLVCGLAASYERRVRDEARRPPMTRRDPLATLAFLGLLLLAGGVLARRLGNGPGAVGRGVPH